SAAWLAHLTGGQGVAGSNPAAPTELEKKGTLVTHRADRGVFVFSSWSNLEERLADAANSSTRAAFFANRGVTGQELVNGASTSSSSARSEDPSRVDDFLT